MLPMNTDRVAKMSKVSSPYLIHQHLIVIELFTDQGNTEVNIMPNRALNS